MLDSSPIRSSSNLLEQSTAFGVSLGVHVIFLVILAMIILPLNKSRDVTTIVGEFDTTTTFALDDILEPVVMTSEEKQSDAPNASIDSFINQIADANFDTAPHAELAPPLTLSSIGAPVGGLNEKVSPVVSVASANSTGDGVNGTGQAGEGGSGFFGLKMTGSKVVYVVDCSRSMNYPYPGPAKTRFGRVQLELLQTIARMDETQKFFMVFFNHAPIPMPADRLMEATPGVQQRYLKWMSYLKAGGSTEPEQALLIALSLNPEVIYFLTDGDFDYRVVPNVTRANRKGVVINTIGFGDDRGELFLKEIAVRNAGEYRFIPGGDIPVAKSIVSQLKMKTQAQREQQ